MDSFEWNKIVGAVLGATLFVLVLGVVAEAVFHVEPLPRQAYIVEGVDDPAAPPAPPVPAEEPLPDFAVAIPAANIQNGTAIADRCAVCHEWTEGAPHKIGPNIFGIVGGPRAAAPGFNYSAATRARGGSWTYEDLYLFLRQPAVFIPGNTMAFAGLPRSQDRLDLIAYMRMWADTPAPLPPPRPAAPEPETPDDEPAPVEVVPPPMPQTAPEAGLPPG